MFKIPKWNFHKKFIYPFFLVHMGMFWGSWFLLAYFADNTPYSMALLHWWVAISVYLVFYLLIFGVWRVRDMFINAIIWCVWIYAWMWDIVSFFGKDINSFDWYWHLIPSIYFVLYTFLLRNILKDSALLFSKKYGEQVWDYIFYWLWAISAVFSII